MPFGLDLSAPQILELSGIGDKAILQNVGIDVKVHLPGVGSNVQEHLFAGLSFGESVSFFFVDSHIESSTFPELKETSATVGSDPPGFDFQTFDALRDPVEAAAHLALQ